MRRFVLDASVALCWYFEDQRTHYSEAVFDCLARGNEGLVAPLFPYEVLNSLVVAWRQKSISPAQLDTFLGDLKDLPLEVAMDGIGRAYTSLLRMCREHQLSSYDAAYLDLALFEGLPLATLDKNLRAAARRSGIELFDPSK